MLPERAGGTGRLSGWSADDHAAAYAVWRLTDNVSAACDDPRSFFESRFVVSSQPCHFTGYYEPELEGRRAGDARFCHPLHAAPAGLGEGQVWHSRREIMAGGLLDGLELVWLDSAIEAFLAQVQGSVRVRLEDGSTLRLGYAGKNGHEYRSIGQELIRRGAIAAEAISAEAIRDWCAANPGEVARLLAHNPSYVFFRAINLAPDLGPIGSSGVPLTAMRSLAADPAHVPPGSPVWVECGSIRALFVAQDTGSAIRGADRADLFCGSGAEAGCIASGLNAQGTMHVFRPRDAVPA
ncbi:MAG TPA: MltA domain-containing protein [Albidovulum sp.]|uniref:MltA domain-containing protein n=1 Tax=Albidovulum sp. TaxID=1872424 RepID=UPI002B62B132|nr:MltA domain-containing protein [Albidovulum sp.]